RSTWPVPGLPTWTSCHDRTSGPPGFSKQIARAMTAPFCWVNDHQSEGERLSGACECVAQGFGIGYRQRADLTFAEVNGRLTVDKALAGGGMVWGRGVVGRENKEDPVVQREVIDGGAEGFARRIAGLADDRDLQWSCR